MTDEILYVNELRTLETENEALRRERDRRRIELLNVRTHHQQQLEQMRAELSRELEDERARLAAAPSPQEVIKDFTQHELKRAHRVGSAATKLTVAVGVSPEFYYGSLHHKDVRVLEQIALRNQSIAARDAIARGASNLALRYSDVITVARIAEAGILRESRARLFRNWIPRNLLSLARVVADQKFTEQDSSDAAALYRLAIMLWGAETLDRRSVLILSEQLDHLRRYDDLDTLIAATGFKEDFPVQHALLAANRRRREEQDSSEWLDDLNVCYAACGFAPIAVEDGDSDLLSRLSVKATPVTDGPLVTVLMPTHDGTAYIATAIRSVLEQTWRALELIIIDDHSDPGEWRNLQDIVGADERVKLIRLPAKEGAYRARLRGLAEARGEFVTVHDDDDWSHPQKIESQVRHLLGDERVTANMSFQTRIDPNGIFLRINDNPEFNQPNYSSLMLRASDVRRLGSWDDLNRGADAEFHDRIRAVTGSRPAAVPGPPLSFMRARSGSLTAGEIRKGALDFGRQTYGVLFANWHNYLAKHPEEATKLASTFEPKARPFAVPDNLKSGSRYPSFSKFDIIYFTDYRFPGGNSTVTGAELRATIRAGLRVGVLHIQSPVLRSPRPFNADLDAAVRELGIPILAMEDRAETELIVARNPSTLQFADNLRSGVKARRAVIVANTEPMIANGREECYRMSDCVRNAKRMFRAPVAVYPESPHIRSLLQAIEPDIPLASSEWTGFLPDDSISKSPKMPARRVPVVGRHSRDHRLKWPDSEADVLSAYVGGDAFQTTVLGGVESVRHIVDLETTGATVHPFGSVDPATFLNGVDFWVYMHSSDHVESFGMSTIEAMAKGCVIIIPPYMEKLFGPGAVYATPSEVPALVAKYWADETLYVQQSAEAIEVARRRFSASSYLTRINALLASEPAM